MQNTREKTTKILNKLTDTKFSQFSGEVHIFPFVLRNGYQNVSQRGFEPKGASSEAFSFFQKVFTGSETITATWKNSTQLNVRDADLGTYNYDFKVGDYYKGMVMPGSEVRKLEIGDVNGNEDFMAMQESQEISIMFSKNIKGQDTEEEFVGTELTEDDMFNLFLIPERFGNKWLYISNIETYLHPQNKNIILTVVTFTSLKDALEKSGRALEQYVQYAAPGEPYAFPYFDIDGNVTLSPMTMNPEPVKYLQTELQGASALSAITIYARKLYWDDENQKWYTSPSKILFPSVLMNPQANPLNKTASPTKNFYFFPDEQVQVRATKDWLQSVKDENQAFGQVKNMGIFTMGSSLNWNSKSHSSNKINSDTGMRTDYINPSWRPCDYSGGSQTKDAGGCPYTTDTIRYMRTDDMRQILIKNSMLFMQQLELPLSFYSTRPYRWSNIKIIGFWTRWAGDRAMLPNSVDVKNIRLGYFVDCNIASMAQEAFETTIDLRKIGSLQMFNGQDTPPLLNPQATNTTICFELTDKVSFTDEKYTGVVGEMEDGIDTVYLSQTTDENGNNLHNDGTPFLMNCEDGNMFPVRTIDKGWVIDAVSVQALHIGKIKVSCFGADTFNNLSNPLFTQTVMSSAMFENENIRNWTTDIILGCWDSSWSSGEINWPLEPRKKINEYTMPINFDGYNFNFLNPDIGWTILLTQNRDGVIDGMFNWSETYEEEQRTGLTHIERRDTPQQIIYTYNTFQCADRTEFINNFGSIQFTCSGSTCGIVCNDGTWYHKEFNCDLSGKRIIANANDFELIDGDYVWHTKQALGSIDCQYNNPMDVINPPNEYICMHTDNSPSKTERIHSSEKRLNGGWNQCIDITITLKEENIEIKLQDTTAYYGYGLGVIPHDPSVQPPEDANYYRVSMVARGGVRHSRVKSQIHIGDAIFTKKEHLLLISGGSTELLTEPRTAGEDEGTWTAIYDGQSVTPVWELQNAPEGVTISNGKVRWNNTLEEGEHTFSVIATHNNTSTFKDVTITIKEPE